MSDTIDLQQLAKELEDTQTASETLFRLHEILSDLIGSSGEALLIRLGDDHYYLADRTGVRELFTLHNPFLKRAIAQKELELITDLEEFDESVETIVDAKRSEIESLLLYPFSVDGMDAVLITWRKKSSEKRQVMVPLMVGTKMVGVTTQVKSTEVSAEYDEEAMERIDALTPILQAAARRIVELMQKERERLEKRFEDLDSQIALKELSRLLVSELAGISGSMENLREFLALARRHAGMDTKTYQHLGIAEDIADNIEQKLLSTLEATAKSELGEELYRHRAVVATQTLFSSTIYPFLVRSCMEERDAVCYMSPRLPQKIALDLAAIHSFVEALVRSLFERSIVGEQLFFDIKQTKQNTGLFLEIILKRPNAPQKESDFLELLVGAKAPSSLQLLYRRFLTAGGTLWIGKEERKELVTLSLYIPAEPQSQRPISDLQVDASTKVGFLFTKSRDYIYANNIARYLFAFGLPKERFVASEDPSIVDADLTHLVIFESKVQDHLLKEGLKDRKMVTMLVLDGCYERERVEFYDFTYIDLEMYKYDRYLKRIEEFLIMARLR